jgi:BirA family biotin operon repressor/biotin-[acetyl-CoA-carboxylase] ligase
MLPEDLSLSKLQRDLPTSIVGRSLMRYEQVGSTNDLVRDRARAGRDEGLVALAEEQTAGRGRMSRAWAAPPGSSLLLSLLLRPTWLPPTDGFALTMLASVALCEAIEQVEPLPVALKWPNDLMLPGAPDGGLRKAAGILSEVEIGDRRIAWVVIGMGVNVNWAPEGIIDGRDLVQVATSLGAAAGHTIDRLALLRALLMRVDTRYLALRQGRREQLFLAWRERLVTLGQPVHIRLPQGELRGVAEDVERSGGLRLRCEDGTIRVVLAGDVEA